MELITPQLRKDLTEHTPYVFIPTDTPAWVINHSDYGTSDSQSIVYFDQHDVLVSTTYHPEPMY